MGEQKITIHDRDRPLLALGLSLVRRVLESRLRCQSREQDRAETMEKLAQIGRLRQQVER